MDKKGNYMIKSLGILIGGIFVGAVGAEIVHKKYPKVMDNMYAKTCEITTEIREAFKNGYANATQSQQAAEPGV